MTNMHYPDEALKKEIQGQVIVQIIVEKDGTADSIIAISRPMEGGLREEAIRLIRQSGKWVPAIRDGINIRSQKRQPFVFKLG
jgi:protein TonB